MNLNIETELEADGRWIAEVTQMPGVLAYGDSRERAVANVEALALRVIAERLENQEEVPELNQLFLVEAGVSGNSPKRAACCRRSFALVGA